MKSTLLLTVCMFSVITGFCQSPKAPAGKDFVRLNWLMGDWKRTNAKPGHSGTERWIKVSDTECKGWGITMKGTDTAYVEKLKLMVKDNLIFYVANVPDNKEPVNFVFTSLTGKSFVCENPKHDFPKKIAYELLPGNKIKATISGDGKSIDYLFEKK